MRDYEPRPQRPNYVGIAFAQVPFTCCDCGYRGVGPKNKQRCDTCSAAHIRERDRRNSQKTYWRNKRKREVSRAS